MLHGSQDFSNFIKSLAFTFLFFASSNGFAIGNQTTSGSNWGSVEIAAPVCIEGHRLQTRPFLRIQFSLMGYNIGKAGKCVSRVPS